MKSKTKLVLVCALVVAMVGSAIAGTLAWLNQDAALTNTFVVGAFTPPKTDPEPPVKPDPDDPDYPDPVDPPVKGVNTFIYEPYWTSNWDDAWYDGKGDHHRLVPGSATVKDPYVGIGKDSEAGYVYVYIENKLDAACKNYVYFDLQAGWEPVTGQVDEVTLTGDTSGVKHYSGGLFKYVDATTKELKALGPDSGTTTGDVWTATPVFTKVNTVTGDTVMTDLQKSESKDMVVHAFLYQKIDKSKADGQQDSNVAMDATETSKTVVEAAAIAWADKIKNPTT